jgi:hypothetical protein
MEIDLGRLLFQDICFEGHLPGRRCHGRYDHRPRMDAPAILVEVGGAQAGLGYAHGCALWACLRGVNGSTPTSVPAPAGWSYLRAIEALPRSADMTDPKGVRKTLRVLLSANVTSEIFEPSPTPTTRPTVSQPPPLQVTLSPTPRLANDARPS